MLERGGVHRAGRGGGDALDLDVVVLEQPVERAPGEGAVRAAALQREVDDLLAHGAWSPGRIPRDSAPLAPRAEACGCGGGIRFPGSWSGTAAKPCGSRWRHRKRGKGVRMGKKRRPREEGVKSLRQVSYRQETYRAVEPLYKIKGLSPSQKSCCGARRAWFRVPMVNRSRGCDGYDTLAPSGAAAPRAPSLLGRRGGRRAPATA